MTLSDLVGSLYEGKCDRSPVDTLHAMQELYLTVCGIGKEGAKIIGDALATFKHPMKLIDLSGNELGDEGVKVLSYGLHNVEELMLDECGITKTGAKHLGEKLSTLKYKMKLIDLSRNELGDEGVKVLSYGLHNVEELMLDRCGITKTGAKHLGEKLSTLKYKMKRINLSGNELGNEGVKLLLYGMHNIEQLMVDQCGITDQGAEYIGLKLSTLKQKIKRIDLSGNELGNEGAKFLFAGLHNVEELVLNRCGITDQGAEHIGLKLSALKHKMKLIDLSWNKLGSEGTKLLAAGFRNVEELVLEDCGICKTGQKEQKPADKWMLNATA